MRHHRSLTPFVAMTALIAASPMVAGQTLGDDDLARCEQRAQQVVIHRDSFGVPHVYGRTNADCVFGFMYARAEDEFHRVELSLIGMLGRGGEVIGQPGLGTDILVRAYEIPRRARDHYAHAPDDIRAICDAGADALNYFLHMNPDVEPALLDHIEPWYFMAQQYGMTLGAFQLGDTGITAQDLLANVNMRAPDGAAGDGDEQIAAAFAGETKYDNHEDGRLSPFLPDPIDGSNMWAIGPSRAASGSAMLFINPHIPIHELYEAHLHSDDGWNFSGGMAYGTGLLPMFGRNAYLGWSYTVNYPDVVDVYEVQIDEDAKPATYAYDSRVRPVRVWDDLIGVRLPDGSIMERAMTFRATHHGPILAKRGDKHWAVRLPRIEEGGFLEQGYRMATATNLAEFKDAVGILGLVFHNVMYADAEGNIYYVYNCAMPRRDESFDWTKPVDGSNSATEWRGYHTLDELPHVLNPASGWMQNCNSSPFTTSAAADNPLRADFPNYIAVRDGDDPRVAMSREILSGDDSITWDEWAALPFDTTVRAAAEWIPKLHEAMRKAAKSDPDRVDALQPLVDTIDQWNRHLAVDSIGSTLFMLWNEAIFPVASSGGEVDLIATLEKVRNALELNFDTWQVEWGDINRIQRPDPARIAPGFTMTTSAFRDDEPSLPHTGGHALAGVVNFIMATPDAQSYINSSDRGTRRRYGIHGHSYMSVVEFLSHAKGGARALSIIPFGISRDPDSPHFFDQAPLYARGEFKHSWFMLEDILANLKRSYHPGD